VSVYLSVGECDVDEPSDLVSGTSDAVASLLLGDVSNRTDDRVELLDERGWTWRSRAASCRQPL
jgi:hypothetical protein